MKVKPAIILMVFIMFMSCTDGKNRSIPNNAPVLVCFGNSLTAGHGATTPGVDDKEKSYPAFLQEKINIPVINAGVSGDTTAQGLSRVHDDVLSKNPHIVIIELGANDLFQGIPLSTTQDNLQKILNILNNGNRKIYLAKFYTETIARAMLTMLQITDYDEQTALIHQYDNMFNTLALSNNAELVDDIWAGVMGIHMSDEHHPNEKGYKIMADNYFAVLKPYLQANNLLK